MNVDLDGIDNIIFDFGGVIVDVEYEKTMKAFAKLGLKETNLMHANFYHDTFLADFEMGLISNEEFVFEVKKLLYANVSDEQVLYAWNSMIGELPLVRLDILNKLKLKYRTFLLSNTNNIHIPHFKNKVFTEHGIELDTCFEKAYYSSCMNLRKPNADIFQFVVKENALDVSKTLFVDDLLDNVITAQNVGLKTLHMPKSHNISDYFSL